MPLIVAKGGIDIGVVSSFILPIIGTIILISTFLAPYLIKLSLNLLKEKIIPIPSPSHQTNLKHKNKISTVMNRQNRIKVCERSYTEVIEG